MSRQLETANQAERATIFGRIADVVVRWPWLVIAAWIVLAVVLPASLPTLKEMAARNPVAILPADAPVTQSTKQMTEAFGESGSQNVAVLVLSNQSGLGKDQEATYRRLVDALRDDRSDVVKLQDFITTPALREFLTGKDGKAWILPVSLAGDLGTPQSKQAYAGAIGVVDRVTNGSDLTVNVTGPAATIADLNHVGETDRVQIELAITVLLFGILLMIYRNFLTMLLPLITIGVSLVVAQAAVAAAAQLGLGLANQSLVFMSGMMVGAGTDYAVFFISRYHDYLRLGDASDEAVRNSLASIGKVVAASAATVAVTFLGMVFAKLGVFSSVGAALAIAIAVAFAGAVTFLPAVMVLAGRRGWIGPRRDLTSRFWRRSGIRIVRRPWAHLVASLIVLTILAGSAGLAHYNYDDRKALPRSAKSSVGYAALEQHFPINTIVPEYLVIRSKQDLRTPQALANLEQMAQRVSQIPGIGVVRGITRPTGEPLEVAKASYQAGVVGEKIAQGSQVIDQRAGDLDRLGDGANELADGLGKVRDQLASVIGRLQAVAAMLSSVPAESGGKTLGDVDNGGALMQSMRSLGAEIDLNLNDIVDSFRWAPAVLTALDASPLCDGDPSCVNSRDALSKLVSARTDGTFDKITELARQLQSTDGRQTLEETSLRLGRAVDDVTAALQSLGLSDPGAVAGRVGGIAQRVDAFADASRQLANGVHQLVEQTKLMGASLGDASTYLMLLNSGATTPAMWGFYVPATTFSNSEVQRAASAFISPDGHAVRYLIQTDLNPFSTAAMDQVNEITDVARGAQPNTTLSDATVSVVGFSVMLRDTRDYYNHDIRYIVVVTIIVVLLILILLLRAFIAPLYLIVSVIVSYLSALGIGTIVFQSLLGQELHWSVPGLTFIILVAVGADYNMLLISRIRDESVRGLRIGVIRTVGSTGGVITAAGLIFAATMFGLVFASLATMVQAGFVVGVGLLLDTFLVRTVTVPALATLMGSANWWPSRSASVLGH
ncbi:MMPL/RND family transporter [Mycolicibacterium sp. CBM1]